tara:strand:- start:1200 stop:2273 length:1074 start_codon:yes stop_codon:yes gene_type:complete
MVTSNNQESLTSRSIVTNADSNYTSHDEISILELWDGLVKQWRMIAVCTLFGIIVTISGVLVYNHNRVPVFSLTQFVVPPNEQAIAALHLATIVTDRPTQTTPWTPKAPTIPAINPAYVFESFKRNLASNALQNKFYQENNIPVVFNIGLDNENLYVNTEWSNPSEAKQWIAGYIEFISRHTAVEIEAILRYAIDTRIKVIQHSLSFLRAITAKQTERKIAKFNNAIAIAEKLNIVERIIQTPLSSNSVPLYYLGSNALRAELDIYLKNSKKLSQNSDEFRLTKQLQHLQTIPINYDEIHIVGITSQATVDQKPMRPSATTILVAGSLISILGGLFLAFVRYLIQRQRDITKYSLTT